MSFSGHAAPALCSFLLFGLISCGPKQAAPTPRYAFLRFENLSGDASLEWAARGASEFLSGSLSGTLGGSVAGPDALARSAAAIGPHSSLAPGISAMRSAAIAAVANHLITGYIERAPAGVRITATDEDLSSHKIVRTETATAQSAFDAMNALAHDFAGNAQPVSTNAAAFQLYATALEMPGAEARTQLERAKETDPHFGRAWTALAQNLIASGDRAGAQALIDQSRNANLPPIDRALLDSDAAALNGDRAAALNALRRMHQLEPADSGVARTLAETETTAGNFREASAVWRQLTLNSPANPDAWNELGYTLAWAGDYDGAMAALRQYATLRPADANPLDSQGDVQFAFGKFTEAAASYSAAQAKAATFLGGGDYYKAAWAKFRAGDKNGADALFEQFRKAREKSGERSVVILQGDWLFRTGRTSEAFALLRGVKNPALTTTLEAELTIWDLLKGDRASAARDSAGMGNANLSAMQFLIRFIALPSASAAEWQARADHMLAAPQFAQLRSAAVGYALILDGKKTDAIPVWEKLAAAAPATDFLPHTILARLKGQAVAHPAPPDPINFNEFSVVADSL